MVPARPMASVLSPSRRALLSLSRRVYYPQSRLASNHRENNTNAGFLGAATASHSHLRRHRASSLPSWRAIEGGRTSLRVGNDVCNEEKLGGCQQERHTLISDAWHPSRRSNQLHLGSLAAVRWFGSSSRCNQHDGAGGRLMGRWIASDTEIRMSRGLVSTQLSSYQYHPSQSESLPLRVGSAADARGMSTSSRHNPENNRQEKGFLVMRNFHSVEEAAEKAFVVVHDLNPRSLSAFWSKVSQLMAQRNQRNQHMHRRNEPDQQQQLMNQLNSIFLKTMGEIKGFGPKELATTALGFAKIVRIVDTRQRHFHGSPEHILHEIVIGQTSQHQRAIFQSIANASENILSRFDARCLSNLAYASAIVDLVPMFEDGRSLFDHIAEKSIPHLEKFEPQDLSNMVWSFEKVRASNPRLFEKVADHIVALNNLHVFKPQELSNTVWAFAKAEESHASLFVKIADHILALDNLHSFNSQNLSNTVWAFAKAEESHPGFFMKMADHIIALDSLHSFKSQNLSNTVWAFAKAEESHPALFKKVADHFVALDSLRSFNSQDLSNTMWAFAKAEESHPGLFKKMADHILVLDNLHTFKSQELSNTVWAFAKAKESHPRLFMNIADHILALDSLQSFNSQVLSNIMWAFATANIVNIKLFEKVAAHAEQHIDFTNLDRKSQTNLLWAFEKAEKARDDQKSKECQNVPVEVVK